MSILIYSKFPYIKLLFIFRKVISLLVILWMCIVAFLNWLFEFPVVKDLFILTLKVVVIGSFIVSIFTKNIVIFIITGSLFFPFPYSLIAFSIGITYLLAI